MIIPTPPQAFDFITSCQENNLAVIGIEGFSYEGKMLKPQLDMIADYSWANARCWIEYRELCNQSAKDFLKHLRHRDRLVLSFVVLSEADWDTVKS